MFKRELPRAWAAGLYHDNKFPDIETTNGTQRYIQDVLNNLGHHAERVNTTGIPRKDERTGEIKWTYAGSTTGSADIPCEIKIPTQAYPVGWKIEIKRGKDDLNKAQKKYQDKMQRVGVFHSVIRVGELDLFWDEYYKIMKKQINQLIEWHNKFEVPYRTAPCPFDDSDENISILRLRARIMKEEVKEWEVEAVNNMPIDKRAKELADILYTVFGTIIHEGLQDVIEKVFDLVHESNMSKLGQDGRPVKRHDGKVLKGPKYKDPELSFLNRFYE
jgi:predicted HAD superfamily Cof-like phosphohydrolase